MKRKIVIKSSLQLMREWQKPFECNFLIKLHSSGLLSSVFFLIFDDNKLSSYLCCQTLSLKLLESYDFCVQNLIPKQVFVSKSEGYYQKGSTRDK